MDEPAAESGIIYPTVELVIEGFAAALGVAPPGPLSRAGNDAKRNGR